MSEKRNLIDEQKYLDDMTYGTLSRYRKTVDSAMDEYRQRHLGIFRTCGIISLLLFAVYSVLGMLGGLFESLSPMALLAIVLLAVAASFGTAALNCYIETRRGRARRRAEESAQSAIGWEVLRHYLDIEEELRKMKWHELCSSDPD